MYKPPIIVTGVPRSRTSLTMDILNRCGLFIGKTCGPTPFNKNGQFEHTSIVNHVEKAYLKRIGADPKMQHPLPFYKDLISDPNRRKKVIDIMKQDGLTDEKPWGFKCCKAVGDWPVWKDAFPNATWIIVRRDIDSIINSVMRTSFMNNRKTRESWREWCLYHLDRFEDMKKELHYYEVWSDNFVQNDFSSLDFLPEIMLQLNKHAKNAVDLKLTSI